MSKVDVIMPQMGESIAEGTLTRWLKEIGETVERDEDLFEISTDKVDADIPSPVAGTLVEILVEEGATVEVNTVVARIDTEGGAAAPSDPQPAAEPVDEEPVLPLAAVPDEEAAAPATATEPAAAAEAPAPAASTDGPESRAERILGKSTPLVRKIAAEHDVDLADVEGSGIAGRVTRDDILAYIETRAAAPAAAPAATPAPAVSAGTPAAWVTEDVKPIPKNIYGVTKTSAEDLCLLFHRKHGLNCIILRTSRFFPEEDDDRLKREKYAGDNAKANEYLFRRVELEDVVSAHIAAAERASVLGFGRYIISATTPCLPADLQKLNSNAPAVVQERVAAYLEIYYRLGWEMFETIDRVYVNEAARKDLLWEPRYDFSYILDHLKTGTFPKSWIAEQVGSKGYHNRVFEDGPYPVS